MYGTPAFNLSSSVGKPNKKRALLAEDNNSNTTVRSTDATEIESHSRSASIASGLSLLPSEQLSSPSGDSAPSASTTLASASDVGEKSPSEDKSSPAPAMTASSGASPAGEECGAARAQAQAATQVPSAGASATGEPATGASAAAAASGGAGAKLPRKSSLRNRSQLTTMASVSEQEERAGEYAEGALLSSLFSDRALAYRSSLSRYCTVLLFATI